MPFPFWLDVVALSISTVVSAALALFALSSGPGRTLARAFAMFAMLQSVWAATSLFLRLGLWVEKGNVLLLSECATLSFALMGPFLLQFASRYVGRHSRWIDLMTAAGLILIGLLTVPLFRNQLISNPRLEPNGSTTLELSTLGFIAAALPLLYWVWSLLLFQQERRRTGEPYLALSVLILLLGFVLGGVLELPFPLLSVTNTASVFALGYGIVSHQLFNPLREQTARLQREVAERIRIEVALRESEEKFRTIFDSLNDAVFIHDADTGAIVDANSQVSEMYGYSRQEIRQLDVEALSSGEAPFTQPEAMAWMEKALADQSQIFEWRARDRQGRLFWTEVSMKRATIGGEERVLVAVRDATNRKQAEEALRASETRTRALLDAIPDMIFEIGRDGTLLDFMPAKGLEPLIQPQHFIGGKLQDVLPQPVVEQALVAIGETFRTGRVQTFEYQILLEDGLHDYEGRLVVCSQDAVLAIVRDITERKRAEQALRESEERYRMLFESSPESITMIGLDGRVIDCNEATVRLSGRQRKDLIGSSFQALGVLDDRAMSRYVDLFAQIVAGAEFRSLEVEVVRGEGDRRWLEVFPSLLEKAGMPCAIQLISRDITERKRAQIEREQLLSDLIHRSTQLVTAAEVSKQASTILEPEELVAQAVQVIRERFHFYYVGLFLVEEGGEYAVLQAGTGQAGRRMLERQHRLAVGGDSMVGQCVKTAEARIALDIGDEAVRFDNPHLPATRSEMALPLVGRGECIGALTVQSTEEAAFSPDDVAALQAMVDQLAVAVSNARLYDQVQRYATRLEDLVAERTAELSAVNKELEAFAYSVSHDLRAPLRSIDGFGQALIEDYGDCLDAVGQDYLRRVRAATQRMGQLIDDLLKLSRLTRRELRREAVDLSALAGSIAAGLHEAEPQRRVEFVIASGVVAQGDAALLRVVLENLLGNAWKFTSKQAEGRVEFGVREVGGTAAYYVRDDGVGFDMAYMDKLFGAFQRLHRVSEFDGTGIGLATVQRIIHRHGGRVWAEGSVGQGATFYFTLGGEGGK